MKIKTSRKETCLNFRPSLVSIDKDKARKPMRSPDSARPGYFTDEIFI